MNIPKQLKDAVAIPINMEKIGNNKRLIKV